MELPTTDPSVPACVVGRVRVGKEVMAVGVAEVLASVHAALDEAESLIRLDVSAADADVLVCEREQPGQLPTLRREQPSRNSRIRCNHYFVRFSISRGRSCHSRFEGRKTIF